jgi:hypothetical protein
MSVIYTSKQPLKTINGESIKGSGNLEVTGTLDVASLPQVTVAEAANFVPILVGTELKKINAKDLKTEGLVMAKHNIFTVATTGPVNLSLVDSVNVIKVTNPGLTITLQMPPAPVENQVCQFTTLTNTVTLIVGAAGSASLDPTFAGAPNAGFAIKYVYHQTDDTWYRIG